MRDTMSKSSTAMSRLGLVLVVLLASCLVTPGSRGQARAVETTTDVLFRVLDHVDEAFDRLDQAMERIETRVATIRQDRQAAIQRYTAARAGQTADGALREKAKAQVMLHIARELVAKAEQYGLARTTLTEARGQLASLREKLGQDLQRGVPGGQLKANHLKLLLSNINRTGRSLEDVMAFTQATGRFGQIGELSLAALKAQYDSLQRAAEATGPDGSTRRVHGIIDTYVRLLDHLVTFYTALQGTLQDRQTLVRIVNEFVTTKLTMARITDSPTLNPGELGKRLRRELKNLETLDRQINTYILEEFAPETETTPATPLPGFEELKKGGRYFQ